MTNYETKIDSTKQIFDPSRGQQRLRSAPGQMFRSAGANQHFADTYRAQGQKAAMDLGRASTENQNAYYQASQKAQDQSVLSGLGLLSQQQANAYQRQAQADQMKYRFMEDIMGGSQGILGGLL